MTTGRTADVDDLWRRFRETGSPELRNQLVLQYSPLVKYVAGRVRSGLPQTVDSADLVSEGVIGLMDAVERFEPERGWTFQTYAVPRIRGAILDSIRASDWVPRSVRSKLRDAGKAREVLELRLGRSPSNEEVAAELGITPQELRDLSERPTSISHADEDEVAALDNLDPAVDAALEDAATRQSLLEALKTLPERDQIVIALYFFEGLTLGEIGQVLSVTESRVSQLRSRATASLRRGLAEVLSS